MVGVGHQAPGRAAICALTTPTLAGSPLADHDRVQP